MHTRARCLYRATSLSRSTAIIHGYHLAKINLQTRSHESQYHNINSSAKLGMTCSIHGHFWRKSISISHINSSTQRGMPCSVHEHLCAQHGSQYCTSTPVQDSVWLAQYMNISVRNLNLNNQTARLKRICFSMTHPVTNLFHHHSIPSMQQGALQEPLCNVDSLGKCCLAISFDTSILHDRQIRTNALLQPYCIPESNWYRALQSCNCDIVDIHE